jgi:hypothetical protein
MSCFNFQDDNYNINKEMSNTKITQLLENQPKFDCSTTTQTWGDYLRKLQEFNDMTDDNIKIIICPDIIMYKDQRMKKLWVDRARKDADEMSIDDRKYFIENWSLGITLTSFISKMKSSGILAIMTNPLTSAVAQLENKAENIIDWHAYVIYYQNGLLAVYDPSFNPEKKNISGCQGVILLKALIMMLKGKKTGRRISSLWIGGGGNDGTRCQEMCRSWIYQEICVKKGHDLQNLDQQVGWSKVSF